MNLHSYTEPEVAMDALKKSRPDILLLDVMMPGIDGWDFYTRLRGEKALADLPVLFVDMPDRSGGRAGDAGRQPMCHPQQARRPQAAHREDRRASRLKTDIP